MIIAKKDTNSKSPCKYARKKKLFDQVKIANNSLLDLIEII